MKTILRISGLCVLLTPMSAFAADFGYLEGGYAAPLPQGAVIQRRAYPSAYPAAGVIVNRREVVIPAQRPTRVIEQRIVEGPGGVTRTTRIYEHSGTIGYGPRPPRDIPLASYPYGTHAPRVVVRPLAAPGAGALVGAGVIASEIDDGEFD